MLTYTCRRCRAEIPAYIHRELTPRRRQRVHLHLNGCAACYTLYLHMRDQDRELAAALPRLGAADAPQLAHIWRGIQNEMRPKTRTHSLKRRMRYSLAVTAMAVALLLPWTFYHGQALAALPLPPTPQQTAVRTYAQSSRVAALSTAQALAAAQATPSFQSNSAPPMLATDTP
jgi:anti-sigma factor RsiW